MDFSQIPFLQDLVILAKPALFNIYFALASIPFGFPFAILLALAKASHSRWLKIPAEIFIYAFRGSPLFIQFFMFYSLMLAFNQTIWKPMGVSEFVLHPLFIGPIVLVLNTSAYAAEIFYGALKAIPKGEIEAARATGMNKWQEFWVVTWPNMLRLAWPAYTNEVVFLFHATALVYFTLPVIDEQKDLMNKASELFKQDYALFVHFSAAAFYFLVISLFIFWLSNQFYKYLTRHLNTSRSIKLKPNYLR